MAHLWYVNCEYAKPTAYSYPLKLRHQRANHQDLPFFMNYNTCTNKCAVENHLPRLCLLFCPFPYKWKNITSCFLSHPSPDCWHIKMWKSHWMLPCMTDAASQQAYMCTLKSVHVYCISAVSHTHTHTCKHTCRVWAMLYNKQRGEDVVSFAPCAIVEKPHEGFWVLKEKPWLAGRESVMQQENCFSPFFTSLISSPSGFFSLPLFPSSVFHQIIWLDSLFFLLHFFHSVAY